MNDLQTRSVGIAIEHLRKSGGFVRTIKIAGTVIGAGLIASSAWVGGLEFADATSVETGMMIVGLVLTVFGSLALLFLDQTTPELIEENLKVLRENVKAQDDLKFATKYQDHLLARITVHSQVRELVEAAVSERCATIEQASRYARSILSLFVERRLSLFGIGDEYWNFGVYHYDNDTKRLVCIACRRDKKEDEDATHRDWEPGKGHVGLAFSRSSEIIFADATIPELRPVLEAQDQNFREYDGERYVSLASIPISTDGSRPLGVLIATSDKAGRFKNDEERTENDWENTDALREVAASLAIIFQMIHAADRPGDANHDSTSSTSA